LSAKRIYLPKLRLYIAKNPAFVKDSSAKICNTCGAVGSCATQASGLERPPSAVKPDAQLLEDHFRLDTGIYALFVR
jgi:hypothetical protein